jgi:tetratricopeptide (TPR) repeat protein
VAAASYLESSWSDEEEVAEVVASHLLEAYDADRDASDAAAIRDRARDALARAGDHAASLAAAASAQHYYERALALGGDESVQANLHAKAGETAFLQGQNSARLHFENAITLLEATHQTAAIARLLSRLARVDLLEGKNDDGIERMQRALAMLSTTEADDSGREADIASVAAQLGKQLYFRGDLDQALECAERALQISEMASLPEAFVNALDTRGCVLGARGRRDEAELLFQGALKVAAEHNVSAERVRILHQNLASTLEEADRLEECLDHYEESEAISRRLGDRLGAVTAQLNRANALLELGRWDECAALYSQYLAADAADLDSLVWVSGVGINIVWLHLRRGDIEAARAVLPGKTEALEQAHIEMRGVYEAARAALANAEGRPSDALAVAEAGLRACLEQSFPIPASINLIEAGDAAFALNRDDKVEELLTLVRGHYRPGRQPSIDAHIFLWQAWLAMRRGDAAETAAKFTRALEAFSELTRPFWLAVTQLQFAAWLLDQGPSKEADDMLVQARSAFVQLGATPWIERVDAAAQGAVAPTAARALPA